MGRMQMMPNNSQLCLGAFTIACATIFDPKTVDSTSLQTFKRTCLGRDSNPRPTSSWVEAESLATTLLNYEPEDSGPPTEASFPY